MALPRTSNYEIAKQRVSTVFLNYDQEKMIRKFGLKSDEDYIYIRFVERDYRIDRKTGVVTRSDDGFASESEGNYNEAMTIYDLLCDSKDDCRLAGSFCSPSMLSGTIQSVGNTDNYYKRYSDSLAGKLDEFSAALLKLGTREPIAGDIAVRIKVFDFMPIIVQFWDADEEFPPVLKFMVDENIQDFIHYETAMFMLGHVIDRINECMGWEPRSPR